MLFQATTVSDSGSPPQSGQHQRLFVGPMLLLQSQISRQRYEPLYPKNESF